MKDSKTTLGASNFSVQRIEVPVSFGRLWLIFPLKLAASCYTAAVISCLDHYVILSLLYFYHRSQFRLLSFLPAMCLKHYWLYELELHNIFNIYHNRNIIVCNIHNEENCLNCNKLYSVFLFTFTFCVRMS